MMTVSKEKAKLTAYNQNSSDIKTDSIFGMWQDKEDDDVVDTIVRNMRQGRNFNI